MSKEAVRNYIDKLGGINAVADLFGVRPTTVHAYHRRLGHFPADTYLLARRELRKRGHLGKRRDPPPELWGMKVSPPPCQ